MPTTPYVGQTVLYGVTPAQAAAWGLPASITIVPLIVCQTFDDAVAGEVILMSSRQGALVSASTPRGGTPGFPAPGTYNVPA